MLMQHVQVLLERDHDRLPGTNKKDEKEIKALERARSYSSGMQRNGKFANGQ